jgi:hypothetical protein
MKRKRRRHRLQLFRRLHDAWYWLKCRLWHRYNVVYVRCLPPTWHDRDYLILYAAFTLLEEFVEKEEGHFNEDVFALYNDYTGDDPVERAEVEALARQREAEWNDIRNLYYWWKARKNDDTFDDYDMDTAMLHVLINVRGHLWT